MNEKEIIHINGIREDLYQAMQIGSIILPPQFSSDLYNFMNYQDKEIERLNNIINTFEDDLEREVNISAQESLFGLDKYTVIHSTLEKMLKYFKELKESGNNE